MAIQVVGSKMPDSAAEQLKPSKRGYGANGYGGASSDVPGENTRADFQATPRADEALRQVAERGTRQIKPVNSENLSDLYQGSAVPIAHGMRPANSGGAPAGKVAGGLDPNEGRPERQPDCND